MEAKKIITDNKLREVYADLRERHGMMGYPEHSASNRSLDARESFSDGFKCAINRTALPREGWISVEDELIPQGKMIYVYEVGHVETHKYGTGFSKYQMDVLTKNITHWMYHDPPKPPIPDNTKEITTKN